MPKFPFTNYHELNLDWILKKVETLFNASEENARTIRTYDTRLNSAEQTATNAETAATSAQQLADAAAATADNALSVAGTANAKADSALTAATNAAGAVSGALTIAQEAQQTAGAAVATANDAAATAAGLESLANTANQNATAAVETAGTAVTTANNAAAAAQTADQKAVAAQQTASTNAGNISTLQTNVTDLNRQISDVEENQIPELKSALTQMDDEIAIPVNKAFSGQLAASGSLIIISPAPIAITGGHTYILRLTLGSASTNPVYFYLRDSDNTTYIKSQTINAGNLTNSVTYTPDTDIDVLIGVNNASRDISYSITFADADQNSRIDKIANAQTNTENFVGQENAISLTNNTYILTPSVGATVSITQTALSGCASAAIPCTAGDVFTLFGTPRNNSGTRAYMWVDSNNNCVFRYDETNVMENVLIIAPYNGTLVVNFLTSEPYALYKGVYNLNKRIAENIIDIIDLEKIKTSPIESLPNYIRNDLSYRPLGQLQKGYLCLVCDDGSEGLGTYTIPMLTQKDVPCTFGLWSTSYQNDFEQRRYSPSVILQSDSGIQLVKNAIEDLGCSVAQHGAEYWTDLTEEQLNDFFDREATRFTEIGIKVSGAVYPGHCVNNRIRPIVGGRFGSCRAGYNGHLSQQDMIDNIKGDVFTPYGSLTGARSNCYSYTSFNIIDADKDINALKTMLDNAIANDMCMICHWHDWNFIDSDADYLANRTKLEAFIDYAKTTSITFCTLGEIPKLE